MLAAGGDGVTEFTGAGVYLGLPDAEYHNDIVPGGSLSSTGARAILRSPAHYQHSLTHKVVKDEFDVGSAVHLQVLGAGWPVDVHEFDSWRTKAAQEARDDSRANGRIPVLVKDYEPVLAMASAVLNHPVARKLFECDGNAEVSAFAGDPVTGANLRARFDWLTDPVDGCTRCVDLKTARDASPEGFARDVAKYGYFVQKPFYCHVLHQARGDADIEFRFVVVENVEPYLVAVYELDAEFDAIGHVRMRRAIDTYAACKASGEWPGYPEITHLVGPPRWLAYEEGLVL